MDLHVFKMPGKKLIFIIYHFQTDFGIYFWQNAAYSYCFVFFCIRHTVYSCTGTSNFMFCLLNVRLDWMDTASQHLLPHSTSSMTQLTVSTRSHAHTGMTRRTHRPGSTPRSASSPLETCMLMEMRLKRKETTPCKAEKIAYSNLAKQDNRTIDFRMTTFRHYLVYF